MQIKTSLITEFKQLQLNPEGYYIQKNIAKFADTETQRFWKDFAIAPFVEPGPCNRSGVNQSSTAGVCRKRLTRDKFWDSPWLSHLDSAHFVISFTTHCIEWIDFLVGTGVVIDSISNTFAKVCSLCRNRPTRDKFWDSPRLSYVDSAQNILVL